jgi:hypothetical protein
MHYYSSMRTFLVLIMLCTSWVAKAQPHQTMGSSFPNTRYSLPDGRQMNDSTKSRPWSLHGYSGFASGFGSLYGGISPLFSIPVGLQLTRRLNDNIYAFAGLSVAPAYGGFNHDFLTSGLNVTPREHGYFDPRGMNIYSRAELGLMYVNDAKTFSISGSIGVQRGVNQMFSIPPMYGNKPQGPITAHQ